MSDHNTPRKIFNRILTAVCEVYEVDKKEVLAQSRLQPLPEVRRMLYMICVDNIGAAFTVRYSHKDRSNIHVGRAKMLDEIELYADVRKKYNKVKELIDEHKTE